MNAAFVCAMEDILDLYTKPFDPKHPQVCMDETSKQLTKETRHPIPAQRGRHARYDYEYERNGVANIFMFFEPLGGRRYVAVTEHRTKKDWAYHIKKLLDDQYADAEKIVLVMDNLNTHVGSSLYETFEPAEARRLLKRLEIHYTPKHGSWLNMAEIELGVLSRQCLKRRIPDIQSLAGEIDAWQSERNASGAHAEWRFTTHDARIKLKRLYPIISC